MRKKTSFKIPYTKQNLLCVASGFIQLRGKVQGHIQWWHQHLETNPKFTKSFRYLKWRVSWTLSLAILGVGFPWHKPYIQLISVSTSILGPWNVWWQMYLDYTYCTHLTPPFAETLCLLPIPYIEVYISLYSVNKTHTHIIYPLRVPYYFPFPLWDTKSSRSPLLSDIVRSQLRQGCLAFGIPSLKLTASFPLKISRLTPQKETIVFQPSMASGVSSLLVSEKVIPNDSDQFANKYKIIGIYNDTKTESTTILGNIYP